MTATHFVLDTRLATDTSPVASLPLCDVLLMNDARYPWLVLVPRRSGLIEVVDLDPVDQTVLWQELNQVSAALRSIVPCEKLNIGVLGNIVRQLHVHVVLRQVNDDAWPGPVWGHGTAVAYAQQPLQTLVQSLQQLLSA